MQVLHFADLYAGKLAAALSRQHPRDLFDVGVLLDHVGIDTTLWHTFLIYLTASPKPAAEMLAPSEPRDFAAVFERQFRGMTRVPVTVDWLMDARLRLLRRIGERMDATTREVLLSLEGEVPAFDRIDLPGANDLPAVRRKLQNLARRTPEKREADLRALVATLDAMAAGGER